MVETLVISLPYEPPALEEIGAVQDVFLTSVSWGIEWQSTEAFLD